MISILIPAYNASKYICTCLDSLDKQTYRDFEVVIVNDCSADNTSELIESYKNKVSFNIRLLENEKNLGVSRVRNKLLDAVKGEYFYFVDADDSLEPNALESLFDCAIKFNADIVTADLFIDSDTGVELVNIPANSADEQRRNNIAGKWAVVWRSLYRTQYIKDALTSFPDGVDCGEDYYFVSMASSKTGAIHHTNQAFYHYRVSNQGSIMRSVNLQGLTDQYKATDMLHDALDNASIYEDEFCMRYLYLKKEAFKTALKTWNWHPEANKNSLMNQFRLKDKVVYLLMNLLSKLI